MQQRQGGQQQQQKQRQGGQHQQHGGHQEQQHGGHQQQQAESAVSPITLEYAEELLLTAKKVLYNYNKICVS